MSEPKKCDPTCPVSIADLGVEARALYQEVKDVVVKAGGDAVQLGHDFAAVVNCTGKAAIDALRKVWNAAKS